MIDIRSTWDFTNPAISEERFLAALIGANDDDQFILQTQIARSYGIRKQFEEAQRVLSTLETELAETSIEGQVRYWLELGRTLCSTTHSESDLLEDSKEKARQCYLQSFKLAEQAGLDFLAIDALHMMTIVDADPLDQIAWNEKALAFLSLSDQAEAKTWEASLRQNLGYAYSIAGEHENALDHFQRSLELRQESGNERGARIAKWMIAKTSRDMNRLQDALAIQTALETELETLGEVDTYVFQELEILYRQLGNVEKANHYASLLT